MPQISGDGYLNSRVNKSGTFYMFLVIDGQKVRRSTCIQDPHWETHKKDKPGCQCGDCREALEKALEKLAKWKSQVEVGVINTESRVRYETIRDNYLAAGKSPEPAQLEDLNKFFKDKYISAITPTAIKKFREWRESQARVLEYKAETLAKEIDLRKLRTSENGKRKLSAKQISEIEGEARKWIENGVKATTNRRLTVLRAMFNRAAEEEIIRSADVPASFCLWENVDNVKTNKFTEEQFGKVLKELSASLHPLVKFLYNTGMRSKQARKITWDMIDENNVLTMPGFLTKNKKPYMLPLVNSKGKAYEWTEHIVNRKNRPHGERVFDDINLRIEWQRACHKLGLGIFDEKTRVYRGAALHDFRRTAVSNMNAKGINRNTAMAVSGHKTDSMYARYGIEDLKTVQTALDVMSD